MVDYQLFRNAQLVDKADMNFFENCGQKILMLFSISVIYGLS